MTNQLIVLDDKDSRRELWGLIHRLPPRMRVEFLQDCCGRVATRNRMRLPVPAVWKMRATVDQAYRCDKADTVLTNEIYMDLVQLFNTYDLDALATATRLEALVKRLRL